MPMNNMPLTSPASLVVKNDVLLKTCIKSHHDGWNPAVDVGEQLGVLPYVTVS